MNEIKNLFLPTGSTVHEEPWPTSLSVSRRLFPYLIFSSLLTPVFFRS